MSEIKTENSSFAIDLRLQFIGAIDHELLRIIRDLNLEENVIHKHQVPRKKALEYTFNPQVLLLILNIAENNKGRRPGKLFEYLRSSRPVICLDLRYSDVNEILTETNSGITFEYDQGLKKKLIMKYYEQYQNKNLFTQQKNIKQYSMSNLFGKISDYLDELTK